MIYEYRSRIRYSECDENAKLPVGGIVNYYQDTATFHGEDLGIGVSYLTQHHLAWLLSYWQINVRRLPDLGEKIITKTWAYDFKAFYGLRNLTMETDQGEPLSCANSVWILMDMEKQLPVRVSEEMQQLYGVHEKFDMEYTPRKVKEPKAEGAGDIVCLPRFEVTHHHLDTNHHVNNGQYIQMALECLEEPFTAGRLRVEYKKQARLGDGITPLVETDTGTGAVTVALRGDDGASFAVAEIVH